MTAKNKDVVPAKELSDQDLNLLFLAKKGNFEKVISILDDDCYNNINASDAEGYTLLYYAIEGNDIPLIEKLIEKNVDLNYTPPALCWKRHEINNLEIITLLFKHGKVMVDTKGATLMRDLIGEYCFSSGAPINVPKIPVEDFLGYLKGLSHKSV